MKRFLLTLLKSLPALILLTACGSSDRPFTLKGHFRHLQSGDFYVYSTDPTWQGFDTVHVDEGRFRYSRPITDTLVLTIQYPNFMQMQVIVAPGKTTTIKGDANNLLETRIGGLEDNELLSDFRKSLGKQGIQAGQSRAEEFIRNHPASFASVALLQRYFLATRDIDYARAERLLKLMMKAAPHRTITKSLRAQLSQLAQCAPGRRLPSFSAVTEKGDSVTDKTFRGKNLVIWFWAMWSADMKYPVIHVAQYLKKHPDRLQALNICLDADTAALHQTIKHDSLRGHIVCDRQEWNSPLVRSFGVRDVPSAILVDTAGTVIARDLNEEALGKELERLGIKNKD